MPTKADVVKIDTGKRIVEVTREDIEDPTFGTLDVIRRFQEAGDNDVDFGAFLDFPTAFGCDVSDWRQSEFRNFMERFFAEYAKTQELEPGESSGSGE
ncbi:hypothetical protein DUY81_14045 [Acidipropionibacterium acidipropionici]|uniref:Uncharacterized protein n=1 Tax=Acidipropionibacterium acidipropionici TaxID=1748 RepID=A0AAC8YH34_9ACTN|nr:hypothetical protein [Acidipropionibacterium acidipropionici]AMS06449.1 hypothetical protein AXH35_14320 [Acidipropionibacterium acidipropionici]AOZ47897.1 hypothetical protein A8L58_15780 [Acidipropionibacterium acidipropionici]AZP38757.1 hypothetical protein DUY81_14045 [Acidipropionibacterium acidipropionici]